MKKLTLFILLILSMICLISCEEKQEEFTYNQIDKQIDKYLYKVRPELTDITLINPLIDSGEKQDFSAIWFEQTEYCFTFKAFGYQWIYDIQENPDMAEKAKQFWADLTAKKIKSDSILVEPDLIFLFSPTGFSFFPGDRVKKLITQDRYVELFSLVREASMFSDYNKRKDAFLKSSYRLFTQELLKKV